MKRLKRGFVVALFALLAQMLQAQPSAKTGTVSGTVKDAQSGETLIGAFVEVKGGDAKAISAMDGTFVLEGVPVGNVSLKVSYLGYLDAVLEGVKSPSEGVVIEMTVDGEMLSATTVTAEQRRDTQASLMRITRETPLIISNVSAQEIGRTQDSNAGEVIRRVPGISLIDDKFVMVRGLSQRYNNVWINGGAAPSSEADSRAFSFDLIPSSQIDNLTIVKVLSAEYPADYSGGFILIQTRDVPERNSFNISAGGNFNDRSFNDFISYDGKLGALPGGIGASLPGFGGKTVDLKAGGLDNDWSVRKINPISDRKLSASLSKRWDIAGHRLGLSAAANWSQEFRTLDPMQNNLFGVYDHQNNRSNYLRHSVDSQYNDNSRLGAMLNMTWIIPSGAAKFQFKNIFNRIDNHRYTFRDGISAQANEEKSAEYFYRSRTTYNGQLTGTHYIADNTLDWCAGFSYADRIVPDRRRYLVNDALESGVFALTTGNDVSREWTDLREDISTLSLNDKQKFHIGEREGYVKAGLYGEYRARRYNTRMFIYNWNVYDNTLPAGFQKMDVPGLLSNPEYFAQDRLHLLEEQRMRNNYRGRNWLGSAYVNASIPIGRLEILGGLRYEYNDMELISNTRNNELSESGRHYRTGGLFPSATATFRIDDRQNLRLSYGRSVNRPEFREVSSSVYYDFDLASDVQGNTDLRNCYIDNLDLRYELYPSSGETISIAAFYKHFDSPIEWTYTVSGGTDLVYSYKNALSADNIGLEMDLRKNLAFIGLDNFSVSFNGALIHSKVHFEEGSREEDRPMQGQSPYLVNGGIFYNSSRLGLDIALLYNRIGKRIIGVGRTEGSIGGEDQARVPDSYEMPRNSLDLTFSKKFGEHFDLKLYFRNLLGEGITYKQFEGEIGQITRAYNPGRNIGLQFTYTL